jgi:hypothetical protein
MNLRLLVSPLLMFLTVLPAAAQERNPYSRRNTFSFFTEYSNTSSHIILGVSQNRRLVGLGLTYTRRVVHTSYADLNYAVELHPVTLFQQPYATDTLIRFGTIPVVGANSSTGTTISPCRAGTILEHGFPLPGVTYTRTCETRWSYTGGLSPLGVRVNIAPRKRLQPFIVGNAGFLVSTHDIPYDNSARFNFTFEFGAGLELFHDHSRSIAAEYRIQHLSNAYRAFNNPGIDNQVVKLTYSFGR